jgi:peptidyl-prolyl cis-trans isomerase A (cyclophilin A)
MGRGVLTAMDGVLTAQSMKRLVFLACVCAASARAQAGRVTVSIETSLGRIEAELDSARAPGTVTNFLRHMDAHAYEGGRLHRTVTMANQPNNAVKIEVIQAGPAPEKASAGLPPIPPERTNVTGLHHDDGALSMARGGPDSATSDFFICIGAQPELDFGGKRNADGQGFAAFGRMTNGMDVVRRIHASAADVQRLTPPITIVSISRRR